MSLLLLSPPFYYIFFLFARRMIEKGRGDSLSYVFSFVLTSRTHQQKQQQSRHGYINRPIMFSTHCHGQLLYYVHSSSIYTLFLPYFQTGSNHQKKRTKNKRLTNEQASMRTKEKEVIDLDLIREKEKKNEWYSGTQMRVIQHKNKHSIKCDQTIKNLCLN